MKTAAALELLSRETLVKPWTAEYGLRGARVLLPNGWEISVGYDRSHGQYGPDPEGCEVAIFSAANRWEDHDDAMNNAVRRISAEDLLRLTDTIARAHVNDGCHCPYCSL